MAILIILTSLVFLTLLYQTASSLLSFRRNLHTAQQSGLRYLCRPAFELNYFYFILQPLLHQLSETLPAAVKQVLDPTGYLDIYRKEWRFYVKHAKHQQLGDAFFVVSPGMLLLEVADAELCVQITGRRLDFVKPAWAYVPARTCGRNIVEADEEIWKRHRRIIAPQYSPTIHSFVWDQATSLANEMFTEWHHSTQTRAKVIYSAPETSRESRDLNSLAMRVIVAAAFGMSIPFRTPAANTLLSAETDRVVGFADSLRVVVGGVIPVMLFPRWALRWGFPYFRRISKALDHVYSYILYVMSRSIETSAARGSKKREFTTDGILNGITGALARGPTRGENELDESEVIGNIFMLALAGSGTTADTMHFAMILLALNQGVQNWVLEELDSVTEEEEEEEEEEGSGDLTYAQSFPKLARILCVMMETLRLFPPVVSIPKWTDDKAQTLTLDGKSFTLPPRTMISISAPGLHYNPKIWGKDASTFRPQRWLSHDGKSLAPEPAEGGFMSFSRGARACLGKRFSEAEFVAVLAVVLREHRLELAVDAEMGETLKSAQNRARKALANSVNHLSLHVGGEVPLHFVKRK